MLILGKYKYSYTKSQRVGFSCDIWTVRGGKNTSCHSEKYINQSQAALGGTK